MGAALLAFLQMDQVCRRAVGEFANRAARAARPHPALGTLTEREREIVGLVCEGLSNDEIAQRLMVSPATARTHVSRAMVKLGARDRAQLRFGLNATREQVVSMGRSGRVGYWRRRTPVVAGVLMAFAAAAFATVSIIHFEVDIPIGFTTVSDSFPGAAPPEARIAAVVAVGATAVLTHRAKRRATAPTI